MQKVWVDLSCILKIHNKPPVLAIEGTAELPSIHLQIRLLNILTKSFSILFIYFSSKSQLFVIQI